MMLLLTLLLVCQVSKVTVDGGDAGTETMVNVANDSFHFLFALASS
jgi:hypothetical protein